MNDDGALFTIGQLARRTGLPVRTIRFWSDTGALPPAERTSSGWRLYDAASAARLELIATLRELGVGLSDVRRVLENKTTGAEVAAAHVDALDAQIRTLRLRRAVLSTVAKRGSSIEEMALMNRLARLSAQERTQIIDEFLDEVFDGLDTTQGMNNHLRQALPNLPDDPTPEQVDSWVELAELVSDPDFRGASAPWPSTPHGGRRKAGPKTLWAARGASSNTRTPRVSATSPRSRRKARRSWTASSAARRTPAGGRNC